MDIRLEWCGAQAEVQQLAKFGEAGHVFFEAKLGVSLQTEHLKLNVKHRDGPLQRSEQFVPLIIALQLGSPRQWPK